MTVSLGAAADRVDQRYLSGEAGTAGAALFAIPSLGAGQGRHPGPSAAGAAPHAHHAWPFSLQLVLLAGRQPSAWRASRVCTATRFAASQSEGTATGGAPCAAAPPKKRESASACRPRARRAAGRTMAGASGSGRGVSLTPRDDKKINAFGRGRVAVFACSTRRAQVGSGVVSASLRPHSESAVICTGE